MTIKQAKQFTHELGIDDSFKRQVRNKHKKKYHTSLVG